MSRIHWSDHQLDTLRKLWASDLSLKEIGVQLGMSSEAAKMKAKRIGIERPDFNPWADPAKTELLRKLWDDGFSCSQIAARIGGFTRNAIIGKALRLGLTPRKSGGRKGQWVRPRPVCKPKTVRLNNPREIKNARIAARLKNQDAPSALEHPEPEIARKTLLELEFGECRFIPGDPRTPGPIFCALPVVTGTSWCATHLARCTVPVPVRTRPSPATVAPTPGKVDA